MAADVVRPTAIQQVLLQPVRVRVSIRHVPQGLAAVGARHSPVRPPPPPKWPCPSTPERTRCRHRFCCRRRRRCRHRHRCSSPQKKTCPTGVPTLRGQARVRAGAHPARVGVRLRLDAPRRGRNGGGVGLYAVAGGAGVDWATCLRLLERAAADVARDGAVSTAASSTRVWRGVSSFRAAN